MCVPFQTERWLICRENGGTSALVVSDACGLKCGSCHGDLYFDGVDHVCGVIAAMGRAVSAALPAHAFAAEGWVVGQFESEDRRICRKPRFAGAI